MIDISSILITLGILSSILIIAPILFAYFSQSGRMFRKLKKAEKQQLEELYEKKCKGPHKWFEMTVSGEKVHVCKECCWCPSRELFVKPHFVRAELKALIFEEKLNQFTKKRMIEISEKYGVSIEKATEIGEEVIGIKKDFTLKYLDEKLAEMKGEIQE